LNKVLKFIVLHFYIVGNFELQPRCVPNFRTFISTMWPQSPTQMPVSPL